MDCHCGGQLHFIGVSGRASRLECTKCGRQLNRIDDELLEDDGVEDLYVEIGGEG